MARSPIFVALLGVCCLGLGPSLAQTAEQPPDTMEARLLACAACHGAKGQGTDNDYFPRLAGKPAGYLVNQLVAFHNGRRRYPPMNYLLEYHPGNYLQQMADYFAALRPPLPPPRRRCQPGCWRAAGHRHTRRRAACRPARAATARRSPAWSRPFPACWACMRATSARNSAHCATAPAPRPRPTACKSLPASLTEEDVTAVAAWLASRPVPADPSPVPQGHVGDADGVRQRTAMTVIARLARCASIVINRSAAGRVLLADASAAPSEEAKPAPR